MILAGGLSTRLYPLTKTLPKPLVPLDGEANSIHLLRHLRSFGFKQIAMNVHYFADRIVETFGDGSNYDVHLEYLHEPELLGSAGAVKQMEHFFRETFVVVSCDGLTDIPIDQLVAFHRSRKALATIALVHADDVSQYGVVILDENGKIVDFQEKPKLGTERSHLVNTGIYVFEPEIFQWIPPGAFSDFGKQVFPELLRGNTAFYGTEFKNSYWYDIGTLDEYRRATTDVLSGKASWPGFSPTGIARGVHFGGDFKMEGDVHIGAQTRIGNRVRIIGPSVIGDHCVIEDDCVIERSILWDRVNVGAGSRVIDAIVGMDVTLAPSEHVAGGVVANEEPIVRST
ncbi:MAG TPA: NDP-sugar synthase [Candidatus Baltobacteraceae bacterium]|jgi:NDP-sugar pyrophosphorylase family protein|nr:NDP-sugar synthase [Candidatus Baltobacteraceae bacterium]